MSGVSSEVVDRLRRGKRPSPEQEAERARTLLADRQKHAVGAWAWDMETDTVRWSERLHRILGRDPAEFEPSREAFLEQVHPDDRELVEQGVRRALEAVGEFSHEYRSLRPDGELRVMHARGRVIADERGEPTRFVGTCADVTEQREAERSVIRQVEEEEALELIAARAGRGGARRDVLSYATTTVAGLDAVSVAVATVRTEGRPRILAGRGLPEEMRIGEPLDGGAVVLSGGACRDGEVKFVDDWTVAERLPHRAISQLGIRSSVAVPACREELDAAIEAHSLEPGRFTGGSEPFCRALAEALAG